MRPPMRHRIDLDRVLRAATEMGALACFDAPDGRTIVTWGNSSPPLSGPWTTATRGEILPSTSDFFDGGVVGWLGYEAGGEVERMPLPRGPRAAADTCLWRVDGAMHLDPATGHWSIHGSGAFEVEAQALLRKAQVLEAPASRTQPLLHSWAPEESQPIAQRYTDGVTAILEAIRSGEVYQVNLAWEHANVRIDDALGAWLAIRRTNPAQYGAYLRCSGVEVVSNSPELFLEVDGSTRRVQSCPIKGTASRDNGSRQALEESPKERSELTMIVDLVRNDLGRVAVPGTVQAHERTIRQCGDLWHAEQTVDAVLRGDADAVDAVAAAFPPGSVTGAPKVRAMEVIHRLEPVPRGVYTGAIGWFGDNGSARMSVAIRTATVVNGRARFHVGAGIVADSHPQHEWEETLAKAQALAGSLEA